MCMAAETEIGNALHGQHVPVRRAVNIVASRAAFDLRGSVFEKIGAAFVGVALQAGFVFEAAQSCCRARFMRIVAGRAAENAFLETVSFVELEQGEYILMAGEAGLGAIGFYGTLGVYGVAGRAVHGGLAVFAGHKSGIGFGMAAEAHLGFCIGGIIGFECENIRSTALIQMHVSIAVTGAAAVHS